MEKLTKKAKVDSDNFYRALSGEGVELKGLLWPLAGLSPRERAVFTEYHYWNTHWTILAPYVGYPQIPLGEIHKDIMQTVIIFYFGGRSIEKAAGVVWGR